MYLNTPSSGYSQRADGSQAPSTPTHAPRMGGRGLPLSQYTPAPTMSPYPVGAYAPYAMPHCAGGPNVAYGLMTPPDSPDKASQSRGLDFHPMLDARGPPLLFDIRQGMHLSGAAASIAALNRVPAKCMYLNVAGVFNLKIDTSNGAGVTLSDVFGQLSTALKVYASSAEVANAVSYGVAVADQVPYGARRANVFMLKFTFAGLTLRSVQGEVVVADLHLRGSI